MKFVELKKSLSNLERAYVIGGDDRFLCYNALEQIEKTCNLQMADLNKVSLDNPTADDIITSANMYPFGDAYRLVVVNDWSPKTAVEQEKKKIEAYLSNPMPTTILVFFNLQDDTFVRKLSSTTYVDCSKLDAGAVNRYVCRMLSASRVEYDDAAANLLSLYCLYDMQRISNEINKLVSYLSDGQKLTIELVKQMVVEDKEYQVYSLAEMIAGNQSQSAIDLVEKLSQRGQTGLLLALYNNYRRLLYLAVTRASDVEIANELGIKEFAVKMLKNQLGVFSPRKVKQIVDKLAQYDADIKQGRIKEQIAVRLAVIDILKIRIS